MSEFRVNDYITLKLEYNKTVIYVMGEEFIQCKFLLLNIPVGKISSLDEIKSIDGAADKLDKPLKGSNIQKHKIDHKTEFWAHCSNLQVWVKHDYDTRLLHRNMAFPLLKKLTEAGDKIAERVFKEEIAKRMMEGNLNVALYLLEERFLDYLNEEELAVVSLKSNNKLQEHIRKDIGKRKKEGASLPKVTLLILKGLAELGDGGSRQRLIEEFERERERQDIRTHELLIEKGWHKYLDRATMLDMLLEENDAKTMRELDKLIEKQWTESKLRHKFTKEQEFIYTEGYYREHLIVLPTYLINESINNVAIDTLWFSFSNKQVKDLYLSQIDSMLVGFPEPVLKLTALQRLKLSGNEIRKIPEDISNLVKLKELDLHGCYIKNLPESIGKLKSLERLDLSLNTIESLPSCLSELESLKKLDLSHNKLKNLPMQICNLKSLEALSLYSNNLEFLPKSIGQLRTLKDLDLRRNNLITLPDEIGTLESLSNIDISYNPLQELPYTILNMDNLRSIEIDASQKNLYPLKELKAKRKKERKKTVFLIVS